MDGFSQWPVVSKIGSQNNCICRTEKRKDCITEVTAGFAVNDLFWMLDKSL